MKLLFVVNPISGGVDKEPFLTKAHAFCAKYGIDSYIFKTTGKNDKVSLMEALDAFSPDRVISVGGDGTTLFTALALLGTDIPMGIVPQGSANGMAVELGVNPKPMTALQDIVLSSIQAPLDILKINGQHHCMHIGDVGINAQIISAYEKDPNRGMATYAKYFLDQLRKTTPFTVQLEANGELLEKQAYMVALCNARKYGTGVPLNLGGNPMDGKFEIVIVEKVDAKSLLKAGLATWDETFLDNQNGVSISTDRAILTFQAPELLQLDGELIGEFDRLEIEILPGGVQLFSTRQNPYLKN